MARSDASRPPADDPSSHHGVRTFEGLVIVSLTLVGWSSIPLFLRHFAEDIDPWTSNGWRYGFAALIWAPVVIVGGLRRRLPEGLWRRAVVPSVINSIGQVCFTSAHYLIEPGLLTFGLRSQILFVSVGAYLMFESERRVVRSPGYLIGALMVVVGTIGTVSLEEGALDGAKLAGVGLAIASGLFFAMYALAVRKHMHGVNPIVAFSAISQYTAASQITLMVALGASGGLGALALAGQPVVEGPVLAGFLNDQFVLLLLSAVIGIALGHVGYYAAIGRLGVAVSSGVIQLQPFLVLAGSAALFGERMTALQVASGTLAVAGAGLMLFVQHRLNRRDEISVTAMPTAVTDGAGPDDPDPVRERAEEKDV